MKLASSSRRPCRVALWSVLLLSMLSAESSCAAIVDDSPDELASLSYDIVVYGGTSGGVIAAIQARRLGRSVVLLEPGRHLGGLTSGGLGATDIGNKGAIGGLSREFYRRVKRWYGLPHAWKQQRADEYRDPHRSAAEDAMWTFEPHVAERIFDDWILEAKVPVVRQERLVRAADPSARPAGVEMRDGRIVAIRTESGRRWTGRIFIDATYEGDLLAEAGVSYVVGREAEATYGESLNGVRTAQATKHQFVDGVDPYVIAGDPSSGLLPGIDPTGPGIEGAGDHRVQAYCLRMCNTDHPENRRPWRRPDDYDPRDYELLLRNFEAGETRAPWNPIAMPNRKTDTNNNHGFSTDRIGASYDWAEASYERRDEIRDEHQSYQEGLMWTLANDPRVPAAIREEFAAWGPCRDEFAEHDGWSHQLYVREARRMIGRTVMTQQHCQGTVVAPDAIGLAAYTMDSHHVQRHVDASGQVRNEGDVQVGGFPPYGIAYGAIVPRREECVNLFVPVALGASHIAYGSIRMEPVFMVLGQSAATAADLALDEQRNVQDIPIGTLQERLRAEGQVLEWTGNAGLDPRRLNGVVRDDAQAEFVGTWSGSTSVAPYVGRGYRHDGDGGRDDAARRRGDAKEPATAVFDFGDGFEGTFLAALGWTPNPNRASNVPVRIEVDGVTTEAMVDQRQKPSVEGVLEPLVRIRGAKGERVRILVSNAGTDGHVVVDAAALLPAPR